MATANLSDEDLDSILIRWKIVADFLESTPIVDVVIAEDALRGLVQRDVPTLLGEIKRLRARALAATH